MVYDRISVGDRLYSKRRLLGMTQEEIAEKIHRASKYYADIERGSCGMSLETLVAISEALDMSLDYIIWGKEGEGKGEIYTDETAAVMNCLNSCSSRSRKYALETVKLLLSVIREGNANQN